MVCEHNIDYIDYETAGIKAGDVNLGILDYPPRASG